MSAGWAFFSYWIGFIALALSQYVLQQIAVQYYNTTKRREDARNPDHLPMGTGPWVEAELVKRHLEDKIKVLTSNARDTDFFWPSARFIHLSKETYFKRDPTYWAVGAHELGHALIWGKSWLLSALFSTGRAISGLSSIGMFMLLANTVYVEPILTEIAWWTIIIGLVGHLIVLVDEFLASKTAMAILRDDARLTEPELVSARKRLVSAWMTYLGSTLGNALVLVLWSTMTKLIGEAPRIIDPGPLEGWTQTATLILSVLLILRALWVLVDDLLVPGLLSPKSDSDDDEALSVTAQRSILSFIGSVVWHPLAFGFLWLVWDQHPEPLYKAAIALGLYSVGPMLMVCLLPIVLLVVIPIVLAREALLPNAPSRTDEEEEDKRAFEDHEYAALKAEIDSNEDEIASMEAQMTVLTEASTMKPELRVRLMSLKRIAWLPAVIMYSLL